MVDHFPVFLLLFALFFTVLRYFSCSFFLRVPCSVPLVLAHSGRGHPFADTASLPAIRAALLSYHRKRASNTLVVTGHTSFPYSEI